jgi:hypothetical protein
MAAVSTDLPGVGSSAAGSWWRRHGAWLGYGLTALAVWIGWLVNRSDDLVNPEHGVGYWLGITGGSLMAILLLYPVRKKVRFMRFLGATRHWFRMHMVFGVVGPLLILYHCNFEFGALNSNVALICTLLVAGSGLVGRYLYTKIHVDLDGHKATLRELTERARVTAEQKSRASVLAPQLLERMTVFDEAVLTPPEGLLASLALPIRLAVQTRVEYLRLAWFARKQLHLQAQKSPIIRDQRKRLQAATNAFIRQHLKRVRRVAELGSYERLFSLWHIFHLPFFYILVVTAIVHVVAVHMY